MTGTSNRAVLFVVALLVSFALGCFVTDSMGDNEDTAPVITVSPTPTPAPTKTVTVLGPTSTVTQQVPANEPCKEAARYAVLMQEAAYELSTEYGEQGVILSHALKAMYSQNLTALNKELERLEKNERDITGPALKVVELKPQVLAASEACNKS